MRRRYRRVNDYYKMDRKVSFLCSATTPEHCIGKSSFRTDMTDLT
jgi:hypothetical protein